MYQIQNGTPKLIGYASKRLPQAAYHSIRELELLGVCVNICWFKCFLAKVDLDHMVYYAGLTNIMKSKTEPVNARIKKTTRSS